MYHILRDELVQKIGSVYKLVILASQRAVELSAGAQKLVDVDPREKPVNVALKEIAEGKITYKIRVEK